jgi:hypothetical protein
MQSAVTITPALAQVAAGRDHLTTNEFARAVGRSSQTVRKNHCEQGECFGVRPVKVGGRLLWPVSATAALLENGDA